MANETAYNESKKPNYPKISIGMPVYNGEQFIRVALDSLLVQTFSDFELIISDNSSTDGTEAICQEYALKDRRIRYIRQPRNRGAAANFQFVRDEAIGEYFLWAAADDSQEMDFLSHLAQTLDENPQILGVMSDVKNQDGDGNLMYESKLNDIRIEEVKKNWQKIRLRYFRNPTSNIFFAIYGMFRRREIAEVELNYRDLGRYAFSSEIPFLAQIAIIGPVASISMPLKIYVRHSKSLYHEEQKMLGGMDRLLGFTSVSCALLHIVYKSPLPFQHKVACFLTTVTTGTGWIAYNLPRSIVDRLYKRSHQ